LFSASRVERIVGETVASSVMQCLVEDCLFIYGLFNDDINSTDYIASIFEGRCNVLCRAQFPGCALCSLLSLLLARPTLQDSWPLKMGPRGCPETSAWNYH